MGRLLRAAPLPDRLLLLTTFVLTVFMDFVRVLLCGMHEAIEPSIESVGIRALVGPNNICRSMEEVASRVALPL